MSMVVHLGRLKMVVRRKKGKCVYKYCDKDNTVLPGDKVFLLTKMGSIPGRPGPVIFYKAFHRDCFGPWALYCWDTIELAKDGRPKMDLSEDDGKVRANLVRTRARILRTVRTIESGARLDRWIAKLTEVDQLINETGYPVLHYHGRKSTVLIEFTKFIQAVKDRYLSELRVPKAIFDQAHDMGMAAEFKGEMDAWHKEEIESIQKQPVHMEDMMTDLEDENVKD